MLALSRKKNESVVIGDDIVITIVEIRDGKVRLGINAPKSVTVNRQEVHESKQIFGVGAVVKYEGVSQSLIIAEDNPLVLVSVMGDAIYRHIDPKSLKLICPSNPDWRNTYPKAYEYYVRNTL